MTPFIDAIDRLFEELVHDAWRVPGTAQQPRKRESGTTLEMQFPITGASCGDVAVATEGQRLTIRVCRTADRVGGRGSVRWSFSRTYHSRRRRRLPDRRPDLRGLPVSARANMLDWSEPAGAPSRAEPTLAFPAEATGLGAIDRGAARVSVDDKAMINARAETLAEKASFKNAYKRRRCLVLADGFYEWKKEGDNTKTPVYIRLASGEPFAFGGLWEMWQTAEDFILSCTIITTSPNELTAQIHNRMPLILPREAYEQWLDPAERTPDQLNGLLKPYPAELMTAYPVSKLVNSPKNDSPVLIEPAVS